MFSEGVPTFYFQIVVGLYVVELIYIISILVNGIENGSDKLNERFSIGNNLVKSTIMYVLIAGIVILVFNVLANMIIGQALTTT
jgi:transcription initiation factor IIE alpha subunit